MNNNDTNPNIIKNILLSKKVKIILIITVCFVFVIYLLDVFKDKKSSTPIITTAQPDIPAPKNETYYEGSLRISFEFDREKLKLPEALPVYKIIKDPLTEDKIESIAKNLGFTTEAYVANDVREGKIYLYSSKTGGLRILPYTRVVDFKTNKDFDTFFEKVPGQEELKNIAFDFLLKNRLFSDVEELSFFKMHTFSIGEGGHIIEAGKPNMIEVGFTKNAEIYPIFSSAADTGIISIRINAKKEVVSVFYDDLPEFRKDKDYRIKTYDEIVGGARNSSLQSIADGKIAPFLLKAGDVQEVKIKSIEIAYLQENNPEQSILQPIFLLKGTVKLASKEDLQSVTLYLPAIAGVN